MLAIKLTSSPSRGRGEQLQITNSYRELRKLHQYKKGRIQESLRAKLQNECFTYLLELQRHGHKVTKDIWDLENRKSIETRSQNLEL